MKAILITACPSGVATTFLAARRLEHAAQRRGWQVTVEMHGELEPPQPVSDAALRDADLVVVAADHVPDAARFTDKRLFRAPIAEALPDPDAFLSRAEREAAPYSGDAAGADTNAAPAAGEARGKRIVAVTAADASTADVLSTACAVLGDGEARDLVEKWEGARVRILRPGAGS